MNNCSQANRRGFLRMASGAVAFAAGGIDPLLNIARADTTCNLPAPTSVGANTHFSLQDSITPLLSATPKGSGMPPTAVSTPHFTTGQPSQRIQGSAFDGPNSRIFITQSTSESEIVLSFLRWNGINNDTVSDYDSNVKPMTLTDFGHGQSLGVVTDTNGTTWIWMECGGYPRVGDIHAQPPTKICRFPWTPGGKYKSNPDNNTDPSVPLITTALNGAKIYDLQPGNTGMSCSLDTITNTLLVRFGWDANSRNKSGGNMPLGIPNGGAYNSGPLGSQYALYSMDITSSPPELTTSPSQASLIKAVTTPAGQQCPGTTTPPRGGTFQGMCHMGNFIYSVSGDGVDPLTCKNCDGVGNVYLTALDMRDGTNRTSQIVSCQPGQNNGLNIREPEAIWVHRTGRQQRLTFCMTSGGPAQCKPNTIPNPGPTNPPNNQVAGTDKYVNYFWKALEEDCPIIGMQQPQSNGSGDPA